MNRLPSGRINYLIRENEDYENEDGIEAERQQAKNRLEDYVHKLRDSIDDPAMNKKIGAGDKAKLYNQVVDVIAWLDGGSEMASSETYAKKKQELEDIAVPMIGRL
ncbi:heat shock cognate 70 [Venturia nashicola]|uniref:Heat shock cognate 70 n=1 Tax=Venturia nashicola TaxID=86259 RepID=A0A4Z1P8X8_9PEZI|nr:heat shock cognate 70 [Venturia nashicola]TLD34493.1 heat shock cognate 70 [Venturia nashicola]